MGTERITEQDAPCVVVPVGAFSDRFCRTHQQTWNRLHDGPWCPEDPGAPPGSGSTEEDERDPTPPGWGETWIEEGD